MAKIFQVVRNAKESYRTDSGRIYRGYRIAVYKSYLDYNLAFEMVKKLNHQTGLEFSIRELTIGG